MSLLAFNSPTPFVNPFLYPCHFAILSSQSSSMSCRSCLCSALAPSLLLFALYHASFSLTSVALLSFAHVILPSANVCFSLISCFVSLILSTLFDFNVVGVSKNCFKLGSKRLYFCSYSSIEVIPSNSFCFLLPVLLDFQMMFSLSDIVALVVFVQPFVFVLAYLVSPLFLATAVTISPCITHA